jgi:hypothetical protein
VAFTLLLVALAFPIGIAAAPLASLLWSSASTHLGVAYHPFWALVPMWLVVVVLGYWQWFVVVPSLARRVSRVRRGA